MGVDNNGNIGKGRQREDRLAIAFVGGCTGGLLQCLAASPTESFKVWRQVQDIMDPRGGRERSIMAGMGATMLRHDMPHGVWFASYEWFKHELSAISWLGAKPWIGRDERKKSSPWQFPFSADPSQHSQPGRWGICSI